MQAELLLPLEHKLAKEVRTSSDESACRRLGPSNYVAITMQAHQASFHHHPWSRQLATYSESQILCAALHELRALINIQSATHNGANDSGLISIGSKPETPSHTLNLSNLGHHHS
jgi:hypothetical protein